MLTIKTKTMQRVIVASGPVIVEDNKVLLSQHGADSFWKFCGGKSKGNENLVETAIRRAKEELGIDLEILDETPFFLYTKKETPEGILDVIVVHFLAKRIGQIVPGDEIKKWDWLELEQLEQEELAPSILPTLKNFGFL